MLKRSATIAAAGTIALLSIAFGLVGSAQTPDPAALTGQVSSQEEGPMEGVLVSVKRDGSTVRTTVVSNAQGRYRFPRARLEPGRYTVRIRALGYELANSEPLDVTAQQTTQLNLQLRKVEDISRQLTNAEWFASMPGTKEQKHHFAECVTCHTLERIVRSRYTAEEFPGVLQKMNAAGREGEDTRPQSNTNTRTEDNDYLASVNLSKVSRWKYPFKTLPRPKGKATRVIMTEYDLPRPTSKPHDAVVDAEGMVWYGDFNQPYIGMLDPRTSKVVEYPVPSFKPKARKGMNNIEVDRDGNVWMALFHQAGLAKFDRQTKQIQAWKIPDDVDHVGKRTTFLAAVNYYADGKVWLGGGMDTSHRFDVKSGQWETFDEKQHVPKDTPAAKRPHGIYDIVSDSKNNLYMLDMKSEYIIKVDAKTMQLTFNATPTMASGPRRGHMDAQDRLWFAEHVANKVGMYDTRTGQFKEWALPTPFGNPYDAIFDGKNDVWVGGMTSDRISRLNTTTGEIVEYLLPRETNVRRVWVDSSTTPATFWVGNNNAASIIKLEPLD